MASASFKWASDLNTALFTVVLVDVWVYTPFIMILLLAGLRSLPTQPFEAAALDGVPTGAVFSHHIADADALHHHRGAVPDARFIQQFDIIYPMTQGGPGDTLLVFQVHAPISNSINIRTSASRPRF